MWPLADNRILGRGSDHVILAQLLWSLRIKWRHYAPLRLCAFARMSLLIQAVVLAKAQRRKGRKGKIMAMVGLNSQRPSKPGSSHIVVSVAAATVESDQQVQPSLPRLIADTLTVPALKSRARISRRSRGGRGVDQLRKFEQRINTTMGNGSLIIS